MTAYLVHLGEFSLLAVSAFGEAGLGDGGGLGGLDAGLGDKVWQGGLQLQQTLVRRQVTALHYIPGAQTVITCSIIHATAQTVLTCSIIQAVISGNM